MQDGGLSCRATGPTFVFQTTWRQEETMAADKGAVPVVESVREGYRFAAGNWTRFLPACALVALTTGFVQVSQMSAGPMVMLAAAVSVLGSCIFSAAVLRKAVRDEFSGPGGLGFGGDELRLIGVSLGLMAVFVPPIVIVSIILAVAFLGPVFSDPAEAERLANDPEALRAAIQESLGPTGSLVFLAVMTMLLAVFILVAVRLVLINAATIGERKMVMFQTWGWSSGNVGRILLAMVLTYLPVLIAIGFISGAVARILLPDGLLSADPGKLFIYGGLTGFVGSLGNLPAMGLMGYLYKGLRPPGFVPR
jgi:hypothetical protein